MKFGLIRSGRSVENSPPALQPYVCQLRKLSVYYQPAQTNVDRRTNQQFVLASYVVQPDFL